ncbi:MAG: SprT family protein [Bacillus sp. (in: firmicutes)]
MNDQELQKLTEDISMELFRKPFCHAAYFNKRLRTVGGRYMLISHNIELNYRHFEKFGMDELVGIIKHELCHYHLHLEGKGYKHKDRDFRKLLAEVGAPRFCSSVKEPSDKRRTTKWHVYECSQCQLEYKRRRNMDVNKYVCGRCRGKLVKK